MSRAQAYTRRTCEKCGRGMQPFLPRKQVDDQMMCPMCANNEGFRTMGQTRVAVRHHQGELDRRVSTPEQGIKHFIASDMPNIVRVAHDSGDSITVFHCFAGETRYITRDGVKTLAETVGTVQEVLTSGTPEYPHSGRWAQAIIHEFGEQRLWKVTLKRNKVTKVVRATADHRWLVASGSRRDQHRIVATQDLRRGHRLPHLRLPVVWAEPDPEAIRMGFVFGDGTIQQRTNQTYGVVTLWGSKRELSKYFDDICNTVSREQVTDNGVRGLAYTSGMKGYTKSLPPLSTPVEYLRGWLMGYFAADGSVGATNTSISSASLEALLHVRDVATVLGIGTYTPTSKWRKGYGSTETQIHQLGFSTQDLDSSFFLRSDQRTVFESKPQHHERFGWTVASVEETDAVEMVYCPRVPGTETFVLEDNIWTAQCPFCGSGQVIARSDGSIECEFCHSSFTVQVQPEFSAFPQTIGGVPVDVPGMGPDQQPMDAPGDEQDMGGPQDPMAAGAQTAGADGGFPPDEKDEEEEDPEAEEDDKNPFAKKSYRTADGRLLDEDSYLQHLALATTRDRTSVLRRVRAANGMVPGR